jgi:hypothetical protein
MVEKDFQEIVMGGEPGSTDSHLRVCGGGHQQNNDMLRNRVIRSSVNLVGTESLRR